MVDLRVAGNTKQSKAMLPTSVEVGLTPDRDARP